MASLHEIKDRIGSVKSTLKITSAMKLVASSKLRKAQRTIETLRPYEKTLQEILSTVSASGPVATAAPQECAARTAVIAISSNSSLCGGFNANVIKKTMETVSALADVEVFSLGRRMADSMRKAGYPSEADYSNIVAHPSYSEVASLAELISGRFFDGRYEKVLLVYNHFVTTSKQLVVVEQYLPFVSEVSESVPTDETEYIVEPSREEVLETLVPQVLTLKFYAAVLDSAAAEHAARTIAMQTATDNAQDLLGELTLEYNKGRQQKITSEILDLLGGSSE